MESHTSKSYIDGSRFVITIDLILNSFVLKTFYNDFFFFNYIGTSSPEILLSIIETVGHNFEARKLGPNIIVGSAAFNLLIITSLCTLTLGLNEKRRINDLKVLKFL